jgi:hypothetical protein
MKLRWYWLLVVLSDYLTAIDGYGREYLGFR